MTFKQTLLFYSAWFAVGLALLGLVCLVLNMLEWRNVYQNRAWYRENPAPEERFTGIVLRNPPGKDWIRIFTSKNGTRLVSREEKAPPGVLVIYREYSYRLEVNDSSGNWSIDIYGAGADVRQVAMLRDVPVDIVGKRVWFKVNGTRIREELWPRKIRVSASATR